MFDAERRWPLKSAKHNVPIRSENGDFMSNFNEIPQGFKVLSIRPKLQISYFEQIQRKTFFLIFFLPLFCIWPTAGFSFGFFLGVVFVCWYGLWTILGVTRFCATHDSLIISYELLGLSRKVSFLAKDIHYFNHFLSINREHNWNLEIVTNQNQKIFNKNLSAPSWVPAEWISEDVITRINYKTFNVYTNINPNLSRWLGSVLADFYGVSFQSQLDNPHRPDQINR